jgi:hypothetical protein
VAALLARMNHWDSLSMGAKWFHAAQALVEHDSAGAEQAFLWAGQCYAQYNQAWRLSVASRWDPDGQDEIDQVNNSLDALRSSHPIACSDMPGWATELLQGNVPAQPLPCDGPAFLIGLADIAAQLQAARQPTRPI